MVTSPRKRSASATSSSNGRNGKKVAARVDPEDIVEIQDDDGEEADDDEEEEEEYEIEAIREHRAQKNNLGKIEYLIKWKGYPESENTWEPEEHASNSQYVIDAYWKTIPSKSQPNKFERQKKKPRGSRNKAKKEEDDAESGESEGASAQISEDDEPEPARPAKKPKRVSKKRDSDGEEIDEYEAAEEARVRQKETFDRLSKEYTEKYDKMQDWEDVVTGVDTMERGNDEVLMCRLQFRSDKQWAKKMRSLGFEEAAELGPSRWVKETVASRKCPQKVIRFYREHLRFSRPNPDPEE